MDQSKRFRDLDPAKSSNIPTPVCHPNALRRQIEFLLSWRLGLCAGVPRPPSPWRLPYTGATGSRGAPSPSPPPGRRQPGYVRTAACEHREEQVRLQNARYSRRVRSTRYSRRVLTQYGIQMRTMNGATSIVPPGLFFISMIFGELRRFRTSDLNQ